MINLGLSAADHAAFEATLRQSHRIRTIVQIHDRNEKVIFTFGGKILTGSVQVDLTASGLQRKIHGPSLMTAPTGPVRTLNLTVLRPDGEPSWLPSTPGDDVAFADNFISVKYGVFVDGLSGGADWVDVPVFWGPITGIEQDGDQYSITGSGKEVLALDPCLLWETLTIRKGTKRTQAIKDMLSAQGENRWSLPEFTARLPSTWSLGRNDQPWAQALYVARGANWQLFYDGYGRARVRPWPQNRVWLFNEGDNGSLLSKPQVTYDISSAINTVEVIGGVPKGKKTAIRVVQSLASHDPLSPESLSRNGQKRWMVHSESSNVTKISDATTLADNLLFQYAQYAVDVQFDSLVIPHLEEGDQVAVMNGGQHVQFILTSFTLPLTGDTNMTIGSNRRVARYRRGKGHKVYLLGSGG